MYSLSQDTTTDYQRRPRKDRSVNRYIGSSQSCDSTAMFSKQGFDIGLSNKAGHQLKDKHRKGSYETKTYVKKMSGKLGPGGNRKQADNLQAYFSQKET